MLPSFINYRRNRIILVSVLTGLVGMFLILTLLTPSAFKARKNVENIKSIQIGMSKAQAVEIMGKPKNKRLSFLNSIDSMYYYEPPFGASEGICIQFDSAGIVNKVID